MTPDPQLSVTLDNLKAAAAQRQLNAEARRKLSQVAKDLARIEGLDCGLADEPVRIVHHLSCTGGTLIAKCLAAMPGAWMMNEIDPFSRMHGQKARTPFTPTDIVSLMRQGDNSTSYDTIARIFQAEFRELQREAWQTGRKLVLREHSHSQFLYGAVVSDRPNMRRLLQEHYPVRAIATVRDPVDSYASMQKHGWHTHFTPSTFQEYCRRYIAFLDFHRDVEIIRYEDFVENTDKKLHLMCDLLNLPFSPDAAELFSLFVFSGDSGRSSGAIKTRPRRQLSEDLWEEISQAEAYDRLCNRLGYQAITN